ncbi:hypothetical protein QBC46DRAFT_93872 [Diplogelasinospora grovesii]|uniref:Uncharacterized protein n=1 Tax=Diplogelasinospora grovesii TaxID=303347 RepID=A0AAN6S9L2_9PEZI|nr:hypothetical protein QBC46DRAFT_93872 [Diplogelasinospora grovesii]
MRRVPVSSVLSFSLSLVFASAGSVVYVTDLTIFTALAPCAQYAVSQVIQYQTYSKCPEGTADLQGCVCTKDNNFASIGSAISSSVSYSCGGVASEDQASAATVLTAYCSQDNIPTFPTPATPVSVYMTDIAEYQNLAPCATSAFYYAFYSLTRDDCQSDATALATCACFKNQNSLLVSQIINTSVKSACSGHTADISSAQAMFAAYCALNNGTSNFPKPTNPPGDMTYYVTDLPQYSSLAPCAASALYYAVQGKTTDLCPAGPQALASCACIKDGVSTDILSSITSSVKWECASTATDDISSAVAVYNFYCSAAKAQVTAGGVTASVAQTSATPKAGSGVGAGGPQATGGGGSSGTGVGIDSTITSGGPKITVIAGAIVGAIAVIAIAGSAIALLRRMQRNRAARAQAIAQHQAMTNMNNNNNPPPPPPGPDFFNGKQELAADSISAPPPPVSPSPSMLKPMGAPAARADNVSPVSAHHSAFTPPPLPNQAELSGQGAANYYPPMPANSAELHAQSPRPNASEMYAPQGQGAGYPSPVSPNTQELQGGGMYPPRQNTQELQGQGSPHMMPQNRSELQGQGGMYPPRQNTQELQGQGSPHMMPPNRTELMGQFNFPQEMRGGYNQVYHGQQGHNNMVQGQQGQFQLQQQAGVPGQQPMMGWQSGPVPEVHEMDAQGRGMRGGPGQAR